jgi:hypothetical protein
MRYFFTIHRLNTIEDDPDGKDLPNETAALSYAEQVIAELKTKSGYKDPGLMMIVQDEGHHTILSLPFLPGCA